MVHNPNDRAIDSNGIHFQKVFNVGMGSPDQDKLNRFAQFMGNNAIGKHTEQYLSEPKQGSGLGV